jgi:hypothetical protein
MYKIGNAKIILRRILYFFLFYFFISFFCCRGAPLRSDPVMLESSILCCDSGVAMYETTGSGSAEFESALKISAIQFRSDAGQTFVLYDGVILPLNLTFNVY